MKTRCEERDIVTVYRHHKIRHTKVSEFFPFKPKVSKLHAKLHKKKERDDTLSDPLLRTKGNKGETRSEVCKEKDNPKTSKRGLHTRYHSILLLFYV